MLRVDLNGKSYLVNKWAMVFNNIPPTDTPSVSDEPPAPNAKLVAVNMQTFDVSHDEQWAVILHLCQTAGYNCKPGPNESYVMTAPPGVDDTELNFGKPL